MLKKLELENNHFADKLTQTVIEAGWACMIKMYYSDYSMTITESLLINLRETNKQVSDLSLSLSNQS